MKIRRKQREKRTHAVQWALLILVASLCFVVYWGVQGAYRVVGTWSDDLPSIEDVNFTNTSKESTMYAADGTTMLAEFQLEKRDPIELSQVSEYAIEATIDTEDVRFYEHTGVDLFGIGRAFINNIRGGDLEGASTITQQLVRNTILTQEANDITMERKIREAELALEMEKRYSKDEILLMYLNTINYGDGCYGIEAAAQNYFQVSAADLTLTQAATLVGIPQSPTYLDPKLYPDDCLKRRNVVLERMLSAGDITQEECNEAKAQDLGLNPAPDAPDEGIYNYPYFTSYVRELLLEPDNPYGCSYADLFRGGLTIYTSLDVDLQEKAEAACAAQRDRMAPELEAALVAIDVETGQVQAMVGGRDYTTSKVNLATGTGGSGRQAGSTFKAFTLAAAIEEGISPKTRIDCSSPMTLDIDGEKQRIENFNNANYGVRTIQVATALSSNTGFMRLSEALDDGAITEMAHRLGVESEFDTVASTTLGSAHVTPLEMAHAYSTLASNGIKRDAIVVTRIEDRDGNVIYEAPDTSTRVLEEDVAGATTKVLRTVFDTANGTAYGFAPAGGQPVAGKTGTASDFTDHWLVGYTPYLTCATWIGNPAGNIATDPSITCNALWQDFMSQAVAGHEIVNFPETKDPTYNNPFNAAQKKKLGAEDDDKDKDKDKDKDDEDEEDEDKDDEDKDDEDTEGEDTPANPDDPSSAPSVVGKTFDQAVEALNDYNAGYYEEYSDTVPAGTVISQRVENGMVVLVISLGPKP